MSDTAASTVESRAESVFSEIGGAEVALPENTTILDESFDVEFDGEESSGSAKSAEPDGDNDGDDESGLGSKSEPYSVKTLPESYVTLKVDGEERTVSVREMTDGYMRQEAFHKRMNQVSAMADQAKKAGEQFKQEKQEFRDSFHSLMNSPDDLFSFLDEHAPEVLDAVSRKALERVIKWRDNPQARAQHEWQKNQAKIDRERATFEAERTNYQQTRQQQADHARYVGEFKPGYEAGMRKAGYPEVTDEFRETVKGLVAARRSSTGKITAKDVEDAIVRTARALGTPTVESRRPAPAPVAAPGQRQQRQQRSKPSAAPQSFSQAFRDLGK